MKVRVRESSISYPAGRSGVSFLTKRKTWYGLSEWTVILIVMCNKRTTAEATAKNLGPRKGCTRGGGSVTRCTRSAPVGPRPSVAKCWDIPFTLPRGPECAGEEMCWWRSTNISYRSLTQANTVLGIRGAKERHQQVRGVRHDAGHGGADKHGAGLRKLHSRHGQRVFYASICAHSRRV